MENNRKRPEEVDQAIGDAIGQFFGFLFVFYLICGIVGVIAYVFQKDAILFVDTVIIVFGFLLQYGLNIFASLLGSIWIIAGAMIGYYTTGEIRGICLGIMIAVIVRHIVKEIVLKIVFRFIEWAGKQ